MASWSRRPCNGCEATLASAPERPALVFLHHPPFKAGIWHMDRQNLLNAG